MSAQRKAVSTVPNEPPKKDVYITIRKGLPEEVQDRLERMLSNRDRYIPSRVRINDEENPTWRCTKASALWLSKGLRNGDRMLFTFYLREDMGGLMEVPSTKDEVLLRESAK